MGGSEVSNKTSENYKSKIIEYMGRDGYKLIRNSSDQSMTEDLVFKKLPPEDKREIWVESKYTDLSISDSDFLTELGRYFISYMLKNVNEKFDLYVFVRKCSNLNRWKHVFDNRLFQKEEAKKIYKYLSNKTNLREEELEKFNDFSYEDFKKFLGDSYVYQVNYEGLMMKINEFKEKERNAIKTFYTKEREPLNDGENILCNFSKIIHYPDVLYIFNLEEGIGEKEVYEEIPKYKPIFSHWGRLFSLLPQGELPDYIDLFTQGLIKKTDFVSWMNESENKEWIGRILMSKLIQNKGVIKGCSFRDYKGKNLFFEHDDLEVEKQEVEDKQVSRYFDKSYKPFVKHKALKIEVKNYNDGDYVFFKPETLFTSDGKELITGKDVRRLHDKFSPNRYDNNSSIKGDLKWWFEFLNLKGNKKETKQELRTTGLNKLYLSVRPPKNGKERDRVTNYIILGE